MAVKRSRFLGELGKFSKVGVDSSILIYHLEDTPPYSELTEAALAAVAHGAPHAVISTISVAELLVKPFTDGRADRVEAVEDFLRALPNTSLVAPGFDVAREAARLRAGYGLRVPDALLMATARTERAQAFLTNDRALRRVKGEGVAILVLDDYV